MSSPETVVDRPRAGRPRDEGRDQEILAAALDAFVAEGFDRMTIEGVAARAGAGKATLYRRWSNKADLVADAIRRHACDEVPLIDTGDVRADLRAFLRALQETFRGVDGKLFATLTAEKIRHPELAEAMQRRFGAERKAHLRRLIRQGVASGQLPADTDAELLAEVGPALLLYQAGHRNRLPADLADRIVDQFLPA
jgi:AcrR family transcriptional regulator